MKTYQIVLTFVFCAFIISCQTSIEQNITQKEDYQKYIETDNTQKLTKELSNLNFWETKYENQPSQYPYLKKIASANSGLFQTTGDIDYLIAAEKNLKKTTREKNIRFSTESLSEKLYFATQVSRILATFRKGRETRREVRIYAQDVI